MSIQSISKVFTVALVMEESGLDAIENNMGVDATGQVFNSIVAIEQYKGAEMNPLVNPGAITTTSMVKGGSRERDLEQDPHLYGDFAGRPLSVNQEVFKSEAETNQRNQAIAMLMYAYGHIKANPHQATDIYTEQCSVSVNAQRPGHDGRHAGQWRQEPGHRQAGDQDRERAAEMLAVMATAGLYDDSGKWLYATGLPAKSGVGGGIIAVSPGQVRHRRDFSPARCGGQQREGTEGDRGHLQRAGRQSLRGEAEVIFKSDLL